MKTKFIFLLSFLFLFLGIINAQQKPDILLKINGEENVGKVIEINETSVKFTFQNETLVYTIKKEDILKITYGSGRIEFINKPKLPSESNASNTTSAPKSNNAAVNNDALASHHNKVAILPFKYLIDKVDAGEEMTYKVQEEAFSFLSKHIGNLELQVPNTTNALLIKAGVSNSNIRGFTTGELCNILGVEYILQGTITQNKTTASNIQTTNGSYKNNSDNNKGNIGSIFGSSGRANSSTFSTSTQNYKTSVTMNVFNDKGENTFSQNHDSFWSSTDAYKITLQYLLKRTPIYRK
jgi:hypothetical protein